MARLAHIAVTAEPDPLTFETQSPVACARWMHFRLLLSSPSTLVGGPETG
jgi:hypothetical protein